MIRIQRQLVLDQDPEIVWTRLADLPAMVSMIPNVTSWAKPEEDRLVVRLQGRVAWVPVRATAQLRVLERTAPERLCLEGQVVRGDGAAARGAKPGLRSAPMAEFAVRWQVRSVSVGTRLDYELELKTESSLEGWLRPLIESRLGGLEAKAARLVGHGRRVASAAA